jgi:hypothetical protein
MARRNDQCQSVYIKAKTDLPDSLRSIVTLLYRMPKEIHFTLFYSILRYIRYLSAEETMSSFSKGCWFYMIYNDSIILIYTIILPKLHTDILRLRYVHIELHVLAKHVTIFRNVKY